MATNKQPGKATAESDITMETEPSTSASSVAKTTDKQPDIQHPMAKPDTDISMEAAPSNPSKQNNSTTTERKFQPKSLFSSDKTPPNDVDLTARNSEYDFLSPLFTNWPGIVTTVLGCYPPDPSSDRTTPVRQGDGGIGQTDDLFHDWPSQSKGLSSVQSIDSFTSHLVLNCDEKCVEDFTSTIVEKINSCLAESNLCPVDILDLCVHDVDLRLIDESVIPILVGKRFLDSVIRVLGMEHSRVKNAFMEMQQLRARGGEGEGSGGHRNGGRDGGRRSDNDRSQNSSGAPRNIINVTKYVHTQFHDTYLCMQ